SNGNGLRIYTRHAGSLYSSRTQRALTYAKLSCDLTYRIQVLWHTQSASKKSQIPACANPTIADSREYRAPPDLTRRAAPIMSLHYRAPRQLRRTSRYQRNAL